MNSTTFPETYPEFPRLCLSSRRPIRKRLSLLCLAGMILFGGCGSNPDKDEGGGSDEAAQDGRMSLNPAQIALATIESVPVGRSYLPIEIELTGDVEFNRDRLVRITSPVGGKAHEVMKFQGQSVRAGDSLLVLQSEAYASAKSQYLAAKERFDLSSSSLQRLKGLWEDKIASEQDYLVARENLASAKIDFNLSKQALLALGFPAEDIATLPSADTATLGLYDLRAPSTGTLINQDVSLGEYVSADREMFVLADLDTVWVVVALYEKDIEKVQMGQSASVFVDAYPGAKFIGTVEWIASEMDENARTLPARIVVTNTMNRLKSGMFSRVVVEVGNLPATMVIPRSALQEEPGSSFVFVETEVGEYERREVVIGARTSAGIEVKSGLREGEILVTRGAFTLKSELEKGAFGDDD